MGSGRRILFISFEGGEGSGKTTQISLLAERLRLAGRAPLVVREPGSTPLGEYLRQWLKSQPGTTPLAELYMFEAARAQLVADVVLPALARGEVVIADRFTDSTVAYQGYGRGLDVEHIRSLNRHATQGRSPDVTFFLDMPIEEALRRVSASAAPPLFAFEDADSPDARRAREGTRFEEEALEFHHRVREGYLEIARQEADRVVVLDGRASREALAERVWGEVSGRL